MNTRIREALINSGKWVRVNDDEREQLFRAFGIIGASDEFACSTLYTTDAAGELVAPVDSYDPRKEAIVPFSGIVKPRSRLAEVLGVEDGQEFHWDVRPDCIYRIFDDVREYASPFAWHKCSNEEDLWEMIADPSRIHPCPVWSEESVKAARAAEVLDFKWVTKSNSGFVMIHEAEPRLVDGVWVTLIGSQIPLSGRFYELKPGQTVALGEIR